MEEPQFQHVKSFYSADSNLYDVNVRAINENKMSIGMRTSSTWDSFEPSPPRRLKVVTKSKNTWWWNDPERKRKRRVAKYKLYATEGKIKRSVKKGFRWLKIKCIKIVSDDA